MSTQKAWGGRFTEDLDDVAASYLASVDVDRRLAEVDIDGSIAHAEGLARINVLSREECETIVGGLVAIRNEIRAGTFRFDPAHEDVHMNIEAALIARVGAVGGKLHTGRSRNDQVATDLRLWSRAACQTLASRVDALQLALLARAEGELDTLLPAYTHLQRAQPNRLAHHLMAYVEMLDRDRSRFDDAARRMNESPLGAGAVAGTTFPLDRDGVARALGFDRPLRNSLDATGDRDFIAELLSVIAICGTHLSRLAEELVIWSTQEFGFVEMADAHATGSSMMPQKKNPDVAELVRGKTGRLVGALMNILVTLKGLPLGYNRDLQEDKIPLFDAVDALGASLAVLERVMLGARFHRARMSAALSAGFVNATEVADYLAARGVPFRDAHAVAGKLVARALAADTDLASLPLTVFKDENEAFGEDIYAALEPVRAVERRDLVGGPARARVEAAVREATTRVRSRAQERSEK